MIKLIRPYVEFAEVETDFQEIFRSGWFSKGPFCDRFRDAVRDYTGARHAFLTTSATTALSLCLKLLDIGPGDEVAVADFSFPATVNVVEDLGARPVFIDVDPKTWNMRADLLRSKCSTRTRAVIFVDALGNPTGLHEVLAVCRELGIPLIEDAACAFGSSERSEHCGSIADLTCFSFHPRKLINTGEGGAITTDRADWAARLAVKLNHGAVVQDGRMEFIDHGFNYRMSELQAALGLPQVAKIDQIVKERNLTLEAACERLVALGFLPQFRGEDVIHNVQSLVFVVPEDLDRDQLIVDLRMDGVETTLGTYCLSALPYYRDKYADVQPVASRLQAKTLTLPCFHGVDVSAVCEALIHRTTEARNTNNRK